MSKINNTFGKFAVALAVVVVGLAISCGGGGSGLTEPIPCTTQAEAEDCSADVFSFALLEREAQSNLANDGFDTRFEGAIESEDDMERARRSRDLFFAGLEASHQRLIALNDSQLQNYLTAVQGQLSQGNTSALVGGEFCVRGNFVTQFDHTRLEIFGNLTREGLEAFHSALIRDYTVAYERFIDPANVSNLPASSFSCTAPATP